jgi:hypothetical protein
MLNFLRARGPLLATLVLLGSSVVFVVAAVLLIGLMPLSALLKARRR